MIFVGKFIVFTYDPTDDATNDDAPVVVVVVFGWDSSKSKDGVKTRRCAFSLYILKKQNLIFFFVVCCF